MRITFLIGNGFDLCVGLKTSYADFLKHYLAVKNDNGKIIEFKNQIKKTENLYNWADVELAMGQLTEKYANIDEYNLLYDDLLDELAKYLETEQKKIDFKTNNEIIQKVFIKSVLQFSEFLTEQDRQLVTTVSNKSPYTYFFISFNYTNIFDECIKILKTHHAIQGNKTFLADIVHTHGKIGKNMVLGVNDKTQIKNDIFAQDQEFINGFIKPQVNINLRNQNNSQTEELIKNSNITIVFGMSLGETDKRWWVKIGQWLTRNTSHILIIAAYIQNHISTSGRITQSNMDRIRKQFFKQTELTAEQQKTLEKQVHVILNSDMFKMDLVKK